VTATVGIDATGWRGCQPVRVGKCGLYIDFYHSKYTSNVLHSYRLFTLETLGAVSVQAAICTPSSMRGIVNKDNNFMFE
jgi:hypothetical protein